MKSVSINGKRFKVINVPAPKGMCFPPDSKHKTIRFPVHGDDVGDLTVIIHELLHASFWNIAEENIDQAGYDIARVLWKLGWRKEL